MIKKLNDSLNVRWRTRPMQEGNQSQSQMSENYISMERRKSRAQDQKLLESRWLTSEQNYNTSFKSAEKKYKYTIPVQGNGQGEVKDKANSF